MASPKITRPLDRDLLRVGALAAAGSMFSLLYYFHQGQILSYGDTVAHINIARRVFDSQTPGLLQLGTVWLPLPHLLMIPFLVFDSLWQSGLGGSIPSLLAYVFSVAGVFRLARAIVGADDRTAPGARVAAWVAAVVYGANPNLIYLQTTAMTESLYLAFFVWAATYAFEFLDTRDHERKTIGYTKVQRGTIAKCLGCVVAAELTRYDGWFLAGSLGVVILVLVVLRRRDAEFRRAGLTFLLGIVVVPALWVAYNAAVYRNPWEFANGPYSARAIEQRSGALNPSEGHIFTAGSYFLKSAQLTVANGDWGRLWLAVAVAALAFAMRRRAFLVPLLLLWSPVFFYAFSMAHSGVPLYIPSWWPFTWYNIRYGIQLLPLFAVSAGILVAVALAGKRYRWALAALVCGLGVVSYASVWRARPLCVTEAQMNSHTRIPLESAVTNAIQRTAPGARFLMYLGDHAAIFQQAGIPLRQVVNEGNHRTWLKPADPEGLWERALADPARYVDVVIAFEGDEVDRKVERKNLTLLSVIHTTGQASARIYACEKSGPKS